MSKLHFVLLQTVFGAVPLKMKVFVFAFLAFAFSTVKEVNAADPAVISAIVGAGATLLNGHADTNAYQLPNGVVIDADKCWQDGSGACPNGNCLDHHGRRGVVVATKTANCKWFCFHRATSCQTQLCCETAHS